MFTGCDSRSASLILMLTVILSLATPALGQDCPELVGYMPESISAVAVAGDYAYLGGVDEFVVADVSDPAAPRLAGRVPLPDLARDVAVSGSYAYVVGDWPGLLVFDLSTPSAPVEVGFAGTGRASGVAVSGSYAYVVGLISFSVVDVSTPSAPVIVEVLPVLDWGYQSDVAVSGGYAYVVGGWEFWVIDVSEPTAPVEVGFVNTFGDTRGVAASVH